MNKNLLKIVAILSVVLIITVFLGLYLKNNQTNQGGKGKNTGINLLARPCTYDDETYDDGAKFPAHDGCNTCTCNNGKVRCTYIACDGGPTIDNIVPNKGTVGTNVTITGSGFAAEENVIKFDIGYIYPVDSDDGTTLTFVVPDGYELCAPKQSMCPEAYPQIQKGTHDVQVQNHNGISNEVEFIVE
jgi:hypothetical protein